MFCNNTNPINISINRVKHFRTKHINSRHHLIRNLVKRKVIGLEYIHIEGADLLTDASDTIRLETLLKVVGILQNALDSS